MVNGVILEESELERLVSVAREHIFKIFGCEQTSSQYLQTPAAIRVNVSLRTRGAIRGSMSGTGDTLQEQVVDATEKACQDNRFSGPLTQSDLSLTTIEVWIQVAATPISEAERLRDDAITLGVDGVEIECANRKAYFKPSVAITSMLLSPQAMFQAVCRKAGLSEDTWRHNECQLYKTKWLHLSEDTSHSVHRFIALRETTSFVLNPQGAVEWVQSAADYLCRNQLSTGDFCYKYNPLLDCSPRVEPNPVRAAGCAYATSAAACADIARAHHIVVATRACKRILERLHQDGESGYIEDTPLGLEPGGRLGTTALLLLAITHLNDKTGQWKEEIACLTGGLLSRLDESGRLRCSFGASPESTQSEEFFPGQALLALAFRLERGDEACREPIHRAFSYYRDHFRAGPTTAFVGWHAGVWSRLARLEGNKEYVDFVFEQVDWLISFQLQNEDSSYDGGFMRNISLPNSSSIVFTEALARAAVLAREINDCRKQHYESAFRRGLSFCSRLRLTEAQSAFLPNPSRAVGGFVRGIVNFEVRADVVQHAITLGLVCLQHPHISQS